jgi:cytochrome c-type biogenesis protein CcmH/NrfF
VTIRRAAAGRLVAILLMLATLAGAAAPTVAGAAQVREHTTVQQMYDDLMCVLCHESLAVAQSAESYQERSYVRQFVAQGLTKKEIEDRMVGLYGTGVLATPPTHGFGLLAYIIPPVVVLLGILVLFYTVPRWRRKAAAARAAAGGPETPAISDRESERIDEELAERF